MNRTECKNIGGVEYCIYCGNPSIHDVDYYNHGREEDHFEKCNCTELKQLREKEQTLNNIQRKVDNFKQELTDKVNEKFFELMYAAELKELKEKYDQD